MDSREGFFEIAELEEAPEPAKKRFSKLRTILRILWKPLRLILGLLKWLWRVKWGRILVILLVIASVSWAVITSKAAPPTKIPTALVRKGPFIIKVSENGELKAERSRGVTAPRARRGGSLQIVFLVPEGSRVKKGDILVQIDPNDFERWVTDAEATLQLAQNDQSKLMEDQAANISRLEGSIENKQDGVRLAELNLQKLEFESPIEIERAKIELKRTKLDLEQAKIDMRAQQRKDTIDLMRAKLRISQAQRDLDQANKALSDLDIHAEEPGLVVYEKIYRGGTMDKIRIGDTMFSGQALLALPDLSSMQAIIQVNEIDAGKVKVGQKTAIKLDAFPEPTFHGKVTSIATLARQKEGEQKVKVFEVAINIDEKDEKLKPGMTVKADIIIDTIPDVVYVPIESVFEKEGKTLAYIMEKDKWHPVDVKAGKRNDNYLVITKGLKSGQRVTLRDPTLQIEDLGGKGEAGKAKQTEKPKEQAKSVPTPTPALAPATSTERRVR